MYEEVFWGVFIVVTILLSSVLFWLSSGKKERRNPF